MQQYYAAVLNNISDVQSISAELLVMMEWNR